MGDSSVSSSDSKRTIKPAQKRKHPDGVPLFITTRESQTSTKQQILAPAFDYTDISYTQDDVKRLGDELAEQVHAWQDNRSDKISFIYPVPSNNIKNELNNQGIFYLEPSENRNKYYNLLNKILNNIEIKYNKLSEYEKKEYWQNERIRPITKSFDQLIYYNIITPNEKFFISSLERVQNQSLNATLASNNMSLYTNYRHTLVIIDIDTGGDYYWHQDSIGDVIAIEPLRGHKPLQYIPPEHKQRAINDGKAPKSSSDIEDNSYKDSISYATHAEFNRIALFNQTDKDDDVESLIHRTPLENNNQKLRFIYVGNLQWEGKQENT